MDVRYAAEFRARARAVLRGKWPLAVIAWAAANLLGGATNTGVEFEVEVESQKIQLEIGMAEFELQSGLFHWAPAFLLAVLVMAVVLVIVGSVVNLGYARFNLGLVDGEEARMEHLVSYFPWIKNALCTRLLVGLNVLVGTLLFVVPGIIQAYTYAMTSYILAEDPELTAGQAMARSRQLMRGSRWRLFCLDLSFIGWALLSALTLGIGNLLLCPYEEAARAAFYRDLTARSRPLDWEA